MRTVNHPLALTLPLAAVLLVMTLACAVTARRGWAGSLQRGGRSGVRTPAASASDAAFAVANRVAAPIQAGAAAIAAVVALLVLLLPMPVAATVVAFVVGLVAVIALSVAASSTGERAAREVPMPARRPGGGSCDGCACGSGGCSALSRSSDSGAATIG